MMAWILAAATVAFIVAALLTRRFCDPESWLHLLDHPNERSLHTQPKPRTGGVAILAGAVSAIPVGLLAGNDIGRIPWLMAGAGLIAALSFLDDRRGLPVAVRLVGHVIGAGVVVPIAGLTLPFPSIAAAWPVWLIPSLSILFLVWMVNLYNFMDGMDGLAGGMAAIGFGTFAVLGLLAGNLPFLILSLSLAAAAGGFLLFNFPPARIFMGDTGSATLGLLAGGLSLWGAHDGVFPFWVAMLVFSPFIVDATATLIRRVWRGERVWQAHRTHYYQRLATKYGHRRATLLEYGTMLVMGSTAISMREAAAATQVIALVAISAFYVFAGVWIDRRAPLVAATVDR